MPSPIQVVVVEDDALFRELIIALINRSTQFECRRFYDQAEAALRDIAKNPPGLLLLDIDLPGMSGIDFANRLRKLQPALPILFLTGHADPGHIFPALKAGASGYLLKQNAAKKLLDAMREVMKGGAPLSGAVAAQVLEKFHPKPAQASEPLSEREREVLEKLSEGLAAKQIADKIGVSFETARTYIRRIYSKLHVRSRGEAVAKYFELFGQ